MTFLKPQGYNINHFDLGDGDWCHDFRRWFNARTQAAAPL
jgi:hypothetical protein